MEKSEADRVLDEFVAGRLTRRDLVARLLALGAGLGTAPGALRPAGAASAGPTFAAQSLDHVALSVSDVGRSAEWYVRHLGLAVTSQGAASAFLRCPGGDFLALFRGSPAGLHHYSFGIPGYDQQEAARRLREAGLVPKLRGGRTYFDDPDGIEVQVSPA
jgi:hypothetical protein